MHDSNALSFYNFKFLFKQQSVLYISFQKVPNLSNLSEAPLLQKITCFLDWIDQKPFVLCLRKQAMLSEQ